MTITIFGEAGGLKKVLKEELNKEQDLRNWLARCPWPRLKPYRQPVLHQEHEDFWTFKLLN